VIRGPGEAGAARTAWPSLAPRAPTDIVQEMAEQTKNLVPIEDIANVATSATLYKLKHCNRTHGNDCGTLKQAHWHRHSEPRQTDSRTR
jgi:hypothetical protein